MQAAKFSSLATIGPGPLNGVGPSAIKVQSEAWAVPPSLLTTCLTRISSASSSSLVMVQVTISSGATGDRVGVDLRAVVADPGAGGIAVGAAALEKLVRSGGELSVRYRRAGAAEAGRADGGQCPLRRSRRATVVVDDHLFQRETRCLRRRAEHDQARRQYARNKFGRGEFHYDSPE